MICKVQKPLAPADAELLIYNKDRSVFMTLPQEDEPGLMKMLGDENKIFVEAEVIELTQSTQKLNFGDRVSDQNW